VLICTVAFFSAVLAVNTAMVYSAISTYSGVVSAEPYRKGLHYNDRVHADDAQRLLGWGDQITIDGNGHIRFEIITRDDRVRVHALDVRVVVGRPTTNRYDRMLALEDSANGYVGRLKPLPPGAWIAAIEARLSPSDLEPVYRARKRIWIAP
jgi:nitrogen fixation protein FixH